MRRWTVLVLMLVMTCGMFGCRAATDRATAAYQRKIASHLREKQAEENTIIRNAFASQTDSAFVVTTLALIEANGDREKILKEQTKLKKMVNILHKRAYAQGIRHMLMNGDMDAIEGIADDYDEMAQQQEDAAAQIPLIGGQILEAMGKSKTISAATDEKKEPATTTEGGTK